MTAVSIDRRVASPQGARPGKPLLRWLVPVLLLAAVVTVAGVRLAGNGAPSIKRATAPAPRFVPLPANPALEAAWGIRFTALLVEGDGGMLDLRYQVLDPAKSGRIHGKSSGAALDPTAQVANLPSFTVESTGKKITSASAIMHFEHVETSLLGRTYSIMYGNSGGLLHAGDKITLQMNDGLQIQHVVVAS